MRQCFSMKNGVNSHLLPEDMVIEILTRLPVRSLVRFRCLSKSWCTLIQSPKFIKWHLEQQRNGKVLLLRRCSKTPGKYDMLSFHDPDSPNLDKLYPNLHIPFLKDIIRIYPGECLPYVPVLVEILGPCNGVVCVAHTEYFILCNPSLREFKKLPPCHYVPPEDSYFDMNAGHGFGLTRTGDFKVILNRPIKIPKQSRCLFYVYNLRTKSWKEIDYDTRVLARKFYKPRSHLFFNDVCHWHASFWFKSKLNFILSFDINTEVIGRLEYPEFPAIDDEFAVELMVLNECFAAVRHPEKGSGGGMEIWVMKEYCVKESWSKQLVISMPVIWPLLPWKNDEWLLTESGEQLTAYASSPRRRKRFKIYGAKYTFRGLIYEESLVSVNHIIT